MRVPLSWLRDYVDIQLSPRELAEQLTLRGMEVPAIETVGAEWTDVVVGRVLAVDRHPDAETLWLTRVDIGRGEPLEIVCGAQNLEVGQLVPTALVGAVLPGDRRIERTKIRGAVSQGMLCSAAELQLGPDADGIHILGSGDELPLGSDVRERYAETVLDIDVKPNRADALSMVGLAREVAALTGARLHSPAVELSESADLQTADHVSVEILETDLCPRFTARYFSNVRNGPSPDWMQRRLVAAGLRPISAVVDVTNYVMHELGQPMHAYDAAAVPDGRIVVRRGRDGELLETIDHERRRLDERMLVIADRERAIGLAGIMGGAGTEVGEKTTRVILESAIFHGPTVRSTARRLGLRSEASMRHEKGLWHELPRHAADRAAQLIVQLTGARSGTGIVDNDPQPAATRRVTISVARTERLLGIELSEGRIDELLAPLEFSVEAKAAGEVVVVVPPHRPDVAAPADVAEEIARAHGYDRIPARLPHAELPAFRTDPSAGRHRARRILAGLGLDEIVTHALIAPGDLRRTGYEIEEERLVRIANPISDAHSILRPILYPSLLGGLAENVRQRRPAAWLFEVGKVYWTSRDRPTPRERQAATAGTGRYEDWELGIALLGPHTPRNLGSDQRDGDVADLKGIIEALHAALGAPLPRYEPEPAEDRHPHRHLGRTARILDPSGRVYGSLGEIHPRIAAAWGVPGRPVDAAIALDRLIALVPEQLRARPVPAAQPLDRDLAVVVSEETAIGEVLRIARMSAGPQLVDLRLFDAYRGPQIGPGRISYALSFRFQPEEAGDERSIEKAINKVRGALRHHLGAEIR
jgi:phenylalanyl-tRNA synthetase beta chain